MVTRSLFRPFGIVSDITEERIYWTDSGRDTIESVTYDGEDRKMIRRKVGTRFNDIALYQVLTIKRHDKVLKIGIPKIITILVLKINQFCPEVIKLFTCSTQLSMKFFLLINVKMPTIVGILTFMSGKNSILSLSEPKINQIS